MKKILLIEDDEILARMYAKHLELAWYKVLVATEGVEGLLIARKEKPALIILDIMLPGKLNGFDVLEKLKKADYTKKIPVIVLTNLDSEKDVAKKIGAAEYLVKVNTKPDQILKKVKQLVK